MDAYEFSSLCQQLGVFQQGLLATGDIYTLFATSEHADSSGVDFEGFMHMLDELGRRLGVDSQIFETFASQVSRLDNDVHTIRKVKLRLKHAASGASSEGWRQFFRACDEDGSGFLEWDEFYSMCRDRLRLTERENHLKILFEHLDADDSGKLSVEEFIAFIEHSGAPCDPVGGVPSGHVGLGNSANGGWACGWHERVAEQPPRSERLRC